MSKLEELTKWKFKDTIEVPDGYDMTTIPDLTRDNFQILVDEHNKVVKTLNELLAHLGALYE